MSTPNLRELDDKIRAAMQAEHDLGDPAGEESLFQMLLEVFQGRRRWLNLYGFFLTFVFFGLTIWCAIRFFDAQETQAALGWATGFLACFLSMAMLKIWFWMEMQKNQVLREVKRLELQVLRLTHRSGA
jgi:hypothetical protein